jgi:hypothetical protein
MSAALNSPIAAPEPAFLQASTCCAECEKLRTQGFVIQPGGRSRRSKNVGTVRVEWHGVYVGYIRADLLQIGAGIARNNE